MSAPSGPISALLGDRSSSEPERVALIGADAAPLTAADLAARVVSLGAQLRTAGLGSADRVGLLVPEGPDLAVALLAVLDTAVAAPVNPRQPAPEIRSQLEGVGASAVLVAESVDREGVHDVDIPILTLSAGTTGPTITGTSSHGGPAPEPVDASLLLMTSGTTRRPKVVPITSDSLLLSAGNVASTLRLDVDDRCLNVMPLFHIHGIVAALLASLVSGGSVVCTPGFDAANVVRWVDEHAPTWYTAVPTIHQAMLDVARRAPDDATWRRSFRVIRSSSAALPVRVAKELEAAFGAPVVEAYGMTEAAHQITSNPLPPAVRKPGTVGLPAGPEVAIMGDEGALLPPGGIGEIVLRGPSVTAGYLADADANAAAFTNGWFRTGDQGQFDAEGYLTITGRLKELVNRGGEKVAPREVDDVLLAHTDVVHAVAFGVPHPRLGEEVAAAVVLRPGAVVTGPQLRAFAAARLAAYKVPRRVVVVDEIPKGPTGKLQRNVLAARLGLDGRGDDLDRPRVEPADDLEREVAALWQLVLGTDEPPGVDEDFFDLGGDSLHATELLETVASRLGRRLPATIFFPELTVQGMAAALRGTSSHEPRVVPVHPEGSRRPLFCLVRGGAVVTMRHLSRAFGPDQPVHALWLPMMHGTDGGSIEELAARCVALVREVQPEGPYYLLGHSLGGIIMYEAARQLAADGARIGLVVLADSPHPTPLKEWRRARAARKSVVRHPKLLLGRRGLRLVKRRVKQVVRPPRPKIEYIPGTDVLGDRRAVNAREHAYRPGPAPGPVAVLSTGRFIESFGGEDLGWRPLLVQGAQVFVVPGNHDTMLGEPHVAVVAEIVATVLREAQEAGSQASAVAPPSGSEERSRVS